MKQFPTSIRIDNDLYKKLTVKAENEMRSITNTINFILKEYFKMEEAKNGKSSK